MSKRAQPPTLRRTRAHRRWKEWPLLDGLHERGRGGNPAAARSDAEAGGALDCSGTPEDQRRRASEPPTLPLAEELIQLSSALRGRRILRGQSAAKAMLSRRAAAGSRWKECSSRPYRECMPARRRAPRATCRLHHLRAQSTRAFATEVPRVCERLIG